MAKSLRDLNDRQADSVAEEIEALQLAGVTVDLNLTDHEAGAFVSALTRLLASAPRPMPHLSCLLTLARERR